MNEEERPYTLVAELTYRCQLQCLYCSNPTPLDRQGELDTSDWKRVLGEAEQLGIVQVNLTGGEPLLRDDLEDLVEEARRYQLYTNLITSGVPLRRSRLEELASRGLDSVQLSFQDLRPDTAEFISGTDVLEAKLEMASWVRELRLPLTINVVLHRRNLDQVSEIVSFAEQVGAERLELANTQYLGWALTNREHLLPSAAAIAKARVEADAARERLRGRMEILFVLPDYHAGVPRACMDGWARRFIVITPDGVALPCHNARSIATLEFVSVRAADLGTIWHRSPGFNAFRGEDWMPHPCRTCDRRGIDFGGCRCQSFHLTGDASATDPACHLSPHHSVVLDANQRSVREPVLVPLNYRRFRSA